MIPYGVKLLRFMKMNQQKTEKILKSLTGTVGRFSEKSRKK
jgi:hypothetical protein